MNVKQRALFAATVATTAFEGDVHGVFASFVLGALAFVTYRPGRLMSIAVDYSDRLDERTYRTVRA